MFNKVILMGRICHDLELKTTPTGVSVVSFRIAVDRKYQVKGEERKSDFFSVVAWRFTAEFVARNFGKGRMIMIEGELQTRQYVDKNNITQNVTEIVADSVYFTGEKSNNLPYNNGGFANGGNTGFTNGFQNQGQYQSAAPAGIHPAETANIAPATLESGTASEFAAPASSGDDDDYPF